MKLAVLGCGSIGRRHARNLAGLGSHTLVLHDPDGARAAALAAEVGGHAVPGVDQALAAAPDAVLVCAPTDRHVELARQALAAGAHCFVEKPVAARLEGVDKLAAEAAARDRVVLVGCNLRFHRPVAALRRWLDDGAVGRPLLARFAYGNALADWRPGVDYRTTYSARADEGGGITLDAIHELDCARWFLGEVTAVTAMTGRVGGLDTDVEDTALALLRFVGGALAEVHLDAVRPRRGRACEVVGDRGIACWQAEGKEPERSVLELIRPDGSRAERAEWQVDLNDMYVEEVRHFLACVEGRERPQLDVDGARRDLELALAVRAAAATGREVQP